MTNMSYCRFQNTNMDLDDCATHMFEKLYDGDWSTLPADDNARREARAKVEILQNCMGMILELASMLGLPENLDEIQEALDDLDTIEALCSPPEDDDRF